MSFDILKQKIKAYKDKTWKEIINEEELISQLKSNKNITLWQNNINKTEKNQAEKYWQEFESNVVKHFEDALNQIDLLGNPDMKERELNKLWQILDWWKKMKVPTKPRVFNYYEQLWELEIPLNEILDLDEIVPIEWYDVYFSRLSGININNIWELDYIIEMWEKLIQSSFKAFYVTLHTIWNINKQLQSERKPLIKKDLVNKIFELWNNHKIENSDQLLLLIKYLSGNPDYLLNILTNNDPNKILFTRFNDYYEALESIDKSKELIWVDLWKLDQIKNILEKKGKKFTSWIKTN